MTLATLTREPRVHARRALAACLAVLLAVVALVATGPAAHADTPDITVDVVHNGSVVGDGDTVPEGDPLLIRIQYDAAEAIGGKQIVISVPTHISVTGDLQGNDAIESVTSTGDGTVTITFKDQIPADVTEGAYAIELEADQVDEDEDTPIIWKIGDDEGGVTFTVEDKIVPPTEITDGYSKSVSPGNLDTFVKIAQDDDGNYVFDGLDPGIENEVLTYTLVIDSSDERKDYPVADTLPEGLSYVADSFTGELTTYNPEETEVYTFDPTVSGSTFSGTVTVPENSSLRITYEVKITDLDAIEELLKAEFEDLGGTSGNFATWLTNTATFGVDIDRTASVRFRGNIPGVGVGEAFSKSGSWTHLEVITDEDGNLEPPAEIEYTLDADLSKWDDRNPNFTLTQNVVISDTLPEQAEWKTDDADFITADGISLSETSTCETGAEDFAADTFVGEWCVDGQTLLINVGKSKDTTASVQVKAQLNTVTGLSEEGSTTILGGTSYKLPNTAEFHYRDGDPYTDGHDAYPVVLPDDRDEGLNDSAVFVKAGPDAEVRVSPGDTADVQYSFTVDTSKEGVDPLHSKIVDEINTEVFVISDPSAVPISGSYAGEPLAHEHFALSIDDAGNLVIELSDAGKTTVDEREEGAMWTIDIVLATVPFTGKETFEIYNKATLFGSDDEPDYWGDDDAEATSFGDEAELRKRIYDTETGEWVADINALIEEGEFVDDRFVYSIELIPRGNYGSAFPVQVFTREDVLPDAVDFLGFVELDADGAPVLDPLSDGTVEMNGNVVASYADGVVTIRQQEGTNLNPGDGRILTAFAVEAGDASDQIVNSIAGSETTITPTGDPSIDIEKWNDEGSAPEYDESGALLNDGFDGDFDAAPGKGLAANTPLEINFTVSNDGREDLVDVVVSDELIDGSGVIHDLSCVFPDESTGTTWAGPFAIGTQFDCTGTLPALESGATHANLAEVTGTGDFTGQVVEDEDEWHAWVPVPSIDIEKWNDEGSAPEYDESGALLNDGFDGDFDAAPGKELAAGKAQQINFTISNDGEEDLVQIAVSDELIDGVGEIADLVCMFPDNSTGTEWEGPFGIGTQFDCTGTLPALEAGDTHADTASVTGTGAVSGVETDDADDWHGTVPAVIPPASGGLSVTGSGVAPFAIAAALLLLLGGGALIFTRRRRQDVAE